jgi:hypothetical protein
MAFKVEQFSFSDGVEKTAVEPSENSSGPANEGPIPAHLTLSKSYQTLNGVIQSKWVCVARGSVLGFTTSWENQKANRRVMGYPVPDEACGTKPAPLPQQVKPPTAQVELSDNRGFGYYCDHLFFMLQTVAARPGSSIKRNAHGESLVGFLHVPRDDFAFSTTGPYTQESRHGKTRIVLAHLLRGYYEDIFEAKPSVNTARVLLTGFGPFELTVNNPTGDFVSHAENMDAAMQIAFGDSLVGSPTDTVSGRVYTIQDTHTKVPRTMILHTSLLSVNDKSMNAKAGSLQYLIKTYKPDISISLGMYYPYDAVVVEHSASSTGLKFHGKEAHHVVGVPPQLPVRENNSAMRAIQRGQGVLTHQ